MKRLIFGFIILVMTANCSAINLGSAFSGNDTIKVANMIRNAKHITKDGVKEEMIVKTKTILRKVRHQ